MTRPCPTCDGEGVIKSEETIAIEFERRLRELGRAGAAGVEAFLVQHEPARERAVHRRRRARAARAGGARPARSSTSRAPRACRSTTSRSRSRARSEEVERAGGPVPGGRRGLVHIVEPHMYDVDDAVGEDRRLHHLGRRRRAATSARSASCASRRSGAPPRPRSLVGDAGAGRGGEGADEALESGARRRGRRGGRRRSVPRPSDVRSEIRAHVRDRQDRRQAVPRRAGPDPARRAPARRRGRQRRARADPVRSDDAVFDADDLAKVKVDGQGRRHERGEKLRVFKFKPKRGYSGAPATARSSPASRSPRSAGGRAEARPQEAGPSSHGA